MKASAVIEIFTIGIRQAWNSRLDAAEPQRPSTPRMERAPRTSRRVVALDRGGAGVERERVQLRKEVRGGVRMIRLRND